MQYVLVFDLDFTLWNAGGTWCDHLQPPFSKMNNRVIDRNHHEIILYSDVRDILNWAAERDFLLAVASRTYEPDWAGQLLELLDVRHFFHHEQIFPSSKIQHFQNIQEFCKLPFDNMIFFDDEQRNIHDVSALGVTSIFVADGLNWPAFQNGLLAAGLEHML